MNELGKNHSKRGMLRMRFESIHFVVHFDEEFYSPTVHSFWQIVWFEDARENADVSQLKHLQPNGWTMLRQMCINEAKLVLIMVNSVNQTKLQSNEQKPKLSFGCLILMQTW